ncbi:hypothetical protein A5777_07520 [Gordonia sp. 852002-10350_SCH5691597]|nr:hypothetical protein A5777_07520 [Gordonia sp. 852002-10350_SCH5691597]
MPKTHKISRMTNMPPPEGTSLFLIGMRVNHPLRLKSWLYVFFAMPRMLLYLSRRRDSGMLLYRLYLGPSPMVLSYWRSPEALQAFAADAAAPHLPAWRWFNSTVRGRDDVGIWHETYVIGDHETISYAMPPWGLAKAIGGRPIDGPHASARGRLAENARRPNTCPRS